MPEFKLKSASKRMIRKFFLHIRKHDEAVLVLIGSVLLTAILSSVEFNLLEANLYDFRMSKGLQESPSNEIVLITIDDETVSQLDEVTPLPLNYHVKFLKKLAKYSPKAIGYLVNMEQVNQINPSLFDHTLGSEFKNLAISFLNRNIPFLLGTKFDVNGEVIPPMPLSGLPHGLAFIHRDGNTFSEDRVSRQALAYLYHSPSFHLMLAQDLGRLEDGELPRGSYYLPHVDAYYFYFRYHGNPVLEGLEEPLSERKSVNQYPSYSFLEILNDEIDSNALRDKIVLVGTLNRQNSEDFTFTPYSKEPFTHPKLVVHANILDSVMRKDTILKSNEWLNILIMFCMIAMVLWWVLTSKPLSGLLATISIASGFVLFSYYLFLVHGLWIRTSQPLVGVFLAYYLMVPYRLIREYKKRFNYQRKTEILMQVEELKTNFLSLVTHDLKTPVARIQGLAELLMRETGSRLSEQENSYLSQITLSTNELNHFISSILELSRVESDRLKPRRASKDVNLLIEKSVDNLQSIASKKDIEILLNLEPLFPIRIDPNLIQKVISNLIDNAIKYSPPASQVIITSSEDGPWIKISVKDEGIGMSEDEVEKLFTKFYRAKSTTLSKVSGTGLGLYLTKFFVEAHHGRVVVESEIDQGSTFTILLPISYTAVKKQEKEAANPGIRTNLKNVLNKLRNKKEKNHV